jgi:hypothetical protein
MPRLGKGVFLALMLNGAWLGHPAGAAAAPEGPANDKAAICALTQCRDVQRVVLRADDNVHQYQATFDPTPYIWNGTITIYPGEALVFRFTNGTSDNPGTLVFVRAIVVATPKNAPPSDFSAKSDTTTTVQHDPKTGENLYEFSKGSPYAPEQTAEDLLKDEPPGTLIVSFGQVEGHPDMVLRVDHNLPSPLKYDATIDRLSSDGDRGFEKTTICPVQPVLAGMETWPYPLGAATLSNFHFIQTDNGFNCD